jgi:uncharacterized protein (DUF433 family)
MSAIAYPHVEILPNGTALLAGTRTKVIEIVLDRLAHHWDADEIQRQHPHLSLAQIYAALAYYHDHRGEMDRLIQMQLDEVERIRSAAGDSLLRQRLAMQVQTT